MKAPKHFFWIIFILLLIACSPNKAVSIPKPYSTIVIPLTETIIAKPTRTATIPPTAILTVMPFPMLLTPFPLDHLRMVYAVDGKLYLQDGSNIPKPLADAQKDHPFPIFSDDGEKIAFYCGESDRCSINADGNQEINLGKIMGCATFIPNTHQLLVNETGPCNEKQDGRNTICSKGFLIMNTDTGENKKFLKNRSVVVVNSLGKSFKLSPNGKLLSVATSGHIDLLNMNGDVIYPNIMTYTPSTPTELVPMQNWLPDSSGLIVALPTNIYSGLVFPQPAYKIWRYRIGKQAAQISLDKQQPTWYTSGCGDETSISPDGNWLIYSRETTLDETSLYLGNLRNDHTQIYAPGCSYAVHWNPNSKYFLYQDRSLNYWIGFVDGTPAIPVVRFPDFISWMDGNHYLTLLRTSNANEKSKVLITEINGKTIQTYETGIYLPGNISPYYGFIVLSSKLIDRE